MYLQKAEVQRYLKDLGQRLWGKGIPKWDSFREERHRSVFAALRWDCGVFVALIQLCLLSKRRV